MVNPIAFEIGFLQVRWYGIIFTLAIITGTYIAYRLAARTELDPDHILDMVIFIIPAALIGARLYYVAFQWAEYKYDPLSILAVWHGGLAVHGGIIFGMLALLWYVKRYGLSLWNTADVLAPGLVLGQSIGRWGNFFNQEAHGGIVSKEFISSFPVFIQQQMYIAGQFYNPTFLYESTWDFIVFGVLMYCWGRRRVPGDITLLYFVLYSIGRFFIEGLRTDSLMLGPFRVAQTISLVLVIAGIVIICQRRLIKKTST